MSEIIITEEYQKALQTIRSGAKVTFITGKAGSGKSTFLNLLREQMNNLVVLAPTGVAAINVKGSTIHSFFKFGFGIPKKETNIDQNLKSILKKTDLIIIDEISMVRCDLLDGIDHKLRIHAMPNLPFGGKQIVFIGDPYQLPPVVNREEKGILEEMGYRVPYFFGAKCLKDVDMKKIEFNKIFRQNDEDFIGILNNIRIGKNIPESILQLNNSCVGRKIEDCIHLVTTNNLADMTNRMNLDEIKSESFYYQAMIEGSFSEKEYPADSMMELKVGSQIMFLRNNKLNGWRNGSLGKVLDLKKDCIVVSYNGGEYQLMRERWEKIKYKYDREKDELTSEVMGSFEQFPIKLAWAVTIHKSQGKSYDRVKIDLGSGSFAHGQVYVALSRCRTLEGISLQAPINTSDVKVDRDIIEFMKSVNETEKKKIVLFTGAIGSGKDYRASKQIENGAIKLSFADPVREMAWMLLGWTPKDNEEYDQFKLSEIEWMGEKITGRQFLVNIGDGLRNRIEENIWIDQLIEKAKQVSEFKIVISDCRYTNEVLSLVEFLEDFEIEVVFCNYISPRYKKGDPDDDSEWLASELLKEGFCDGEKVPLSMIKKLHDKFQTRKIRKLREEYKEKVA